MVKKKFPVGLDTPEHVEIMNLRKGRAEYILSVAFSALSLLASLKYLTLSG